MPARTACGSGPGSSGGAARTPRSAAVLCSDISTPTAAPMSRLWFKASCRCSAFASAASKRSSISKMNLGLRQRIVCERFRSHALGCTGALRHGARGGRHRAAPETVNLGSWLLHEQAHHNHAPSPREDVDLRGQMRLAFASSPLCEGTGCRFRARHPCSEARTELGAILISSPGSGPPGHVAASPKLRPHRSCHGEVVAAEEPADVGAGADPDRVLRGVQPRERAQAVPVRRRGEGLAPTLDRGRTAPWHLLWGSPVVRSTTRALAEGLQMDESEGDRRRRVERRGLR